MDMYNKSNTTFKNITNEFNDNYSYNNRIVYIFFFTFLCLTPLMLFFIYTLIHIFDYLYNQIYELIYNFKKRINRQTLVIEMGNLEHKIIE